jgi:hypothetical protein
MQMVKSGVPMQRIATDILGELPETENGNKYILVVSDYWILDGMVSSLFWLYPAFGTFPETTDFHTVAPDLNG